MNRRCDVCKHWKYIDNGYGYGKCNMIQQKIDIELDLGYGGGSVRHVETDADFGCNLFEIVDDSNEEQDKIRASIMKAYEG